ncbi:TonB-dependent siderophore receptor [Stutzerimonas stutzeri]|uniref:Metal-pseudopaline receptor CntO n=1 Tax=Stutzerimonas stutzeri TaxID=316 RepID=A0A2S4ATY5_STUST|nr:TonB-dependent siderophore receptor [Stutzerimonas stutzeri]MCQ4261541.1 TonB-dependent siderophore receptor [Stutzerimonas stutzeri]POH84839.1 TonB-dependent siderophore receptor [Stutzerimonas stutzeri]
MTHTNGFGRRLKVVGAISLCALAANAQAKPDPIELDATEVVGTREQGYRATVAPTANKSDTPVKQTPFSIQTVTRELIEDRGVTTFGEAIRTVPGITNQVGFGGVNDRFRLRGFGTEANLKNGVRRANFVAIDDLVNIEQIEVLKGPSSALYGRFEPGGVVNLVTKKPLAEQRTQVDFSAGRYDFYRSTLDTSGPLGDNLGYRLTAAWQDNGSFRDFVDNESQFISPVLTWQLAPETALTFEFEYARKVADMDRGFGNNELYLSAPIERNFAEPHTRASAISKLASVTLDHALDDNWDLHTALQVSDARLDASWYSYGFFNGGIGGTPENPTVSRRPQLNHDRQIDATGLAEVSRRFSTGAIGHRILLGTEYSRDWWDYDAAVGSTSFIDFNNPVYGTPPSALSPAGEGRFINDSWALYAQDELTFGVEERWRLLLGGRFDHIEASAIDDFYGLDEPAEKSFSAFSPRVGLTWTPVDPLSLYASWSRSMRTELNNGILQGGELPSPVKGEQYEVGAKFSLLDGRLTPTLAYFDIRRKDGLVSDPNDPTFTYSIQVGEQRSKGWEIDLPFMITPNWRLLASYTRLNATISDDTDAGLEGNRLANTPQTNASLWTSYDLVGIAPGLSVGVGANYVGEREANNSNTFTLPSYTRWDANLMYRFGQAQSYRVQLNVQNLFDKRYYDSGGSFVPTYPGAPRTAVLTLGATF